MKPPYTSRQGQFLAFIHHYTTLHGRPPAEAEIAQFVQVTPPSAHLMVLTLERRGLITRVPGEARSIRLKLPPEELPPLHTTTAIIERPPRQVESQYSPGQDAALLRLGKIQIADLFAHNRRHPLEDSEFIPILDTLIGAFAHAGLGTEQVRALRRYACESYHSCCQEIEPNSTFGANMEFMFSHLPDWVRTHWLRSI